MGCFALTKAQIVELLAIREEDDGVLARGDPSDLVGSGLAKASNGQGFYSLTASGKEARDAVMQKYERPK